MISDDVDYGADYFCRLNLEAPHKLDVHRTRTMSIFKTRNDGDVDSVYAEMTHKFVDTRIFMLGGVPTGSYQSWTSEITLTDYEVRFHYLQPELCECDWVV